MPAACSILAPRRHHPDQGARVQVAGAGGRERQAWPIQSSVSAVVRGYTSSLRAQSDVPGPGPSGTMDEK